MAKQSKLPIVIVLSPALGGAALNTLPASVNPPTLDEIWPSAPRYDLADLDCMGTPQARIGYETELEYFKIQLELWQKRANRLQSRVLELEEKTK